METCIFCKIVAGQIPCAKIYDDKDVIVFLDINPCAKGHALIVPKKHYDTIYDVPEQLHLHCHLVARKIALHQKEILKCDGGNVFQNVNKCGGQDVPHYHLHVVPRYNNDEKTFKFNNHDTYQEGELELFKDKLKIKKLL
jgi:histidine triad (HIT) family protein